MQGLEAVLYAHRKLLWPLPAAERNAKIEELRLDYLYEEQLAVVGHEMAVVDAPSPQILPRSAEIVAIAVPLLAEVIAVSLFIATIALGILIYSGRLPELPA